MIYDGVKRAYTKKEIDEQIATINKIFAHIDKITEKEPLPDDFIDYVKGRKFMKEPV
jgi:hypothetical protein